MKKMTKKLLAIVVAVMIVMTLCTPAFALDDIISTTPMLNERYISNILNSGIRYYAFVYSEAPEFAWFRENIIGLNACREGYLYVKDHVTGRIWKVLDEQVDHFERDGDALYCVVGGNRWVETNLQGTTSSTIYYATENITRSHLRNGYLFFISGEEVIRLNTENNLAVTIGDFSDINYLYATSDDSFIWGNSENETFEYNNETTTSVSVSTEEDILRAYAASNYSEEAAMEIISSTSDVSAISLNPYSNSINAVNLSSDGLVSFPLPDYQKNVHYFNDMHTSRCWHTGNCDVTGVNCTCAFYGMGIQCMGFAMYASDAFAHRSSYTEPAGDVGGWVGFTSGDDVLNFFAALQTGSYVRLKGYNNYPDHSVVNEFVSGSVVKTYECNTLGTCNIDIVYLTGSDLVNRYYASSFQLEHKFNGVVTPYSTAYHKVACSSAGCTGYVLQPHASGANAYCYLCGSG